MIPYGLAKQLKEAGFPQRGGSYQDPRQEWAYRPTLSELIEACGDKFDELFKIKDGWGAVYYWKELGSIIGNTKVTSQSPEEAVAKLWLKLNKKI